MTHQIGGTTTTGEGRTALVNYTSWSEAVDEISANLDLVGKLQTSMVFKAPGCTALAVLLRHMASHMDATTDDKISDRLKEEALAVELYFKARERNCFRTALWSELAPEKKDYWRQKARDTIAERQENIT